MRLAKCCKPSKLCRRLSLTAEVQLGSTQVVLPISGDRKGWTPPIESESTSEAEIDALGLGSSDEPTPHLQHDTHVFKFVLIHRVTTNM